MELQVDNIYISFVKSLFSTTNIQAGIQGLMSFCGINMEEAVEDFKSYKALELKDANDLEHSNTEEQRMQIIQRLALIAQQKHNNNNQQSLGR